MLDAFRIPSHDDPSSVAESIHEQLHWPLVSAHDAVYAALAPTATSAGHARSDGFNAFVAFGIAHSSVLLSFFVPAKYAERSAQLMSC